MCNIRPSNIYKMGDQFSIINCEFLRNEGYRSDMDSFMIETIENNWQYWPSELCDPYTNELFDYTLDIYAAGCVLYFCVAGCYPFDSKLRASNNQFVKLERRDFVSQIAELFISDLARRRAINLK